MSSLRSWFKSTKTKSGGKYVADVEWKKMLDEPSKSLQESLDGHEYAERVLRRVTSANNFGVNERFERFFDELNLPIGDVELKAIAARNRPAHGGMFKRGQYQALADSTRAYRTLLHRVLLKLSGVEGEYIDYSTYGFPVRSQDCPLGGPEDDGRPAHL